MEDEESIGTGTVKTLYSLFLGVITTVLLTAAMVIVLARLLGPSNYGIYTLAVGFSLFVDAVGNFGIGTYLNVNLSSFRYRKDAEGISRAIVNSFAVLVPIALVFSLIGIGVSGYAANRIFASSKIEVFTLVLASLSIFFAMMYGTTYPALIGLGKGKRAAITNVANSSLEFITSVSLVAAGFGVNGAIAGLVVGYLAGMLAGAGFLASAAKEYGAKLKLKIDGSLAKDILRFSVPVAANNFLGKGIGNFAILMLGVFTTTYLLGNYGAATKGLALLVAVYGTISTVLIATLSASLAKGGSREYIEKSLNKTLVYSLLISLPVIVFVAVFSKPLIYLLITRSYGSAPYFLTLISASVLISVIGSYLSSFFMAAKKVGKMLKYNAFSVLVQFILLLIMVPSFKVIGAIVSVFYVGAFVTSAVFIYGVYKNFGVRLFGSTIARVFISNLILALCLIPILFVPHSSIQLVLGVLVVALIYPATLLVTRSINQSIVEDIKRYSANVPVVGLAVAYVSKYLNTASRIFNIKV